MSVLFGLGQIQSFLSLLVIGQIQNFWSLLVIGDVSKVRLSVVLYLVSQFWFIGVRLDCTQSSIGSHVVVLGITRLVKITWKSASFRLKLINLSCRTLFGQQRTSGELRRSSLCLVQVVIMCNICQFQSRRYQYDLVIRGAFKK